MKRLSCVSALLFGYVLTSACAANSSLELDSVKIGGREYELSQSNDLRCQITEKKSRAAVALALDAPCSFSRRGTPSTVQRHSYRNVGTVAYVFGKPDDIAAFSGQAKVKPEDKCSQQAQAIVIQRDKRIVARSPNKSGMYCPNYGLDEKNFYAAAFPAK